MPSRPSPSQSRRRERILASPRFDGRVFRNTHPVSPGLKPGVERPAMRDILCPDEKRVPATPLPVVDPIETWRTKPSSGLRLTWLGHSTLVIEIDGVRVLTDPVWVQRASPLQFAGPKRFHPPPVALKALPPLDAVILSHDHYDHADRATLAKLAELQKMPFITSLGVGDRLERWGLSARRITELDWWETADVNGVTITAAPAQHFSGRGIRDRNTTLWSSFHLRGPNSSFFYGADSGLTSEYADIAARLGPFDAVALEIGAHHPAWGDIHLGPEGALRARAMLRTGVLLPIHWSTFNLAVHPWSEPAELVFRGAMAAGVPLLMPRLGEPAEPSRAERVEPWWRAVASATPEALVRADSIEAEGPLVQPPD